MAITGEGTYQEFAYTGNIQEFIVPYTGLYKFDIYGAQGCTGYTDNGVGGYGGRSVGYKVLTKGTKIYIVCGGCPQAGDVGYNGGGGSLSTYGKAGGGGATHIATRTGLLAELASYKEDIIMVAGGGGGAHWYATVVHRGGAGGGESGGAASGRSEWCATNVGTQTSGYAFGQGESHGTGDDGAGGGGGYYGGYSATAAGSGGSGYIGGVPEITYKGITYSPSTTAGQNGTTDQTQMHGRAIITLIKKGFPTVYLNNIQKDGAIHNGTVIDTIVFNGIALS